MTTKKIVAKIDVIPLQQNLNLGFLTIVHDKMTITVEENKANITANNS